MPVPCLRAVADAEVGGIVGFRVVRAAYPLGHGGKIPDLVGRELDQGVGDRIRALQRTRPEI